MPNGGNYGLSLEEKRDAIAWSVEGLRKSRARKLPKILRAKVKITTWGRFTRWCAQHELGIDEGAAAAIESIWGSHA